MRSASTWSAMAAPPASAIRVRSPSRSRRRSTATTSSAASVLSGNRNFEGRVSPDVRANFLASPPLVVAYALKGTVTQDMRETPIGQGKDGQDVYLKDIWPSNDEVRSLMDANIDDEDVPFALRQCLCGRCQVVGDRSHRFGHLCLACRLDLCRQPALFRGHGDDAEARHRHHRGQAARHPGRLDHRPTTSARPVRSRRTAPQAPSCRSIRSPRRTSTPTARVVATMT